jgi:excisionase family DNA binding protein
LKQAYESLASVLVDAAGLRSNPPSSGLGFREFAKKLVMNLRSARSIYEPVELELQAAAGDGGCAFRRGLDAVQRVVDAMGQVMLGQVPDAEAVAHVRSTPCLGLPALFDAMKAQLGRAALQHRRSAAERPPATGTAPAPAVGGSKAEGWLTVSEAAALSGINKGTISRLVNRGDVKSNGKKRRNRRIDSADFNRYLLKRPENPESAESNEAVERRLRKAQQRPR